MKSYISNYSKDDFTDLLSEIAFSTITSFGHLLAASSFALNFKTIDLDDEEFTDSFIKAGEYYISFLVMLKALPNMIIEETELLTEQYVELLNKALLLFKTPEKYISNDAITQEHDFLVIAVEQTRFRSILEEMIDGLLSGDLQFYKVTNNERKLTYNLYDDKAISLFSTDSLKAELREYYMVLNCLFDPEETNDMMNYLNKNS